MAVAHSSLLGESIPSFPIPLHLWAHSLLGEEQIVLVIPAIPPCWQQAALLFHSTRLWMPGTTLSLSSATDYGGFIPRDSVCFSSVQDLRNRPEKCVSAFGVSNSVRRKLQESLKTHLVLFYKIILDTTTVINASVF